MFSKKKFTQTMSKQYHRKLRKEYGEITVFPGLLGRPEMVMTFSPEDFEKTLRLDGQFPNRRGLDTLTHYRKNYREDIFGEYGGLVTE